MMSTRLVIDSMSQFHWRMPVTAVVIAFTLFVLLLQRFRARRPGVEQTRAQRQLWYLPLFIGGFEAVGVLSLTLRCRTGPSPQQNMNNVLLDLGAVVIMVVVTLALGATGQSLTGVRSRMTPPAGAFAAALSVIGIWGLVLAMFQQSGIPLLYLP